MSNITLSESDIVFQLACVFLGYQRILSNYSNSGSGYHNYMGKNRVVLMAVCDADYRFLYVELPDVFCQKSIF